MLRTTSSIVTAVRLPLRRAFLAALLVAPAACVPAIPVPPTLQPTPRTAGGWLVEPGDVLRLRVWQVQELSGDLLVNDRGQVLVPNLARLPVAGLTPAAVEAMIIRGFAGRLDSSKVEMTFLRPVAVAGGVLSPGIQLADPSTSVLSLVSRSGGAKRPGGDLRVFLLRVGEQAREISIADRVSDLGIRAADQLYVQDPPFVARNELAIRSVFEALSFMTSLATLAFLVRR